MLTIRLSRRGKKRQPTYRIIISEKSKDPSGDFLDDLGFYNPKTKEIRLKNAEIEYWLSHGAQISPTVHNLLVDKGIIKKSKIKATKVKKKRKEEKNIKTEEQKEEQKNIKIEKQETEEKKNKNQKE